MDVATLKNYIKLKTLPTFLIFSGDEWKVQQIYIEQITKVTGKKCVRIDSIGEIFQKLANRSFVKESVIYIVRDDKELMQNEKLQQRIEKVLGDNMLILLLTNVDKRTKFYKSYKASICDFERLSDKMLEKYTLRHITLSKRNLERFIDICGHDYGRILLEIDKMRTYMFAAEMQGYDMDGDEAFEILVKDGTIHVPAKDAIFDFVDEVLNRHCNNSFQLLQECYDVGEATMVMLSVLYNNAKAVLQVQTCKTNDISKTTGLTGWQIKNAKPHLHKYTDAELVDMLKLIQECESGIKTGRIEEQFVMQYILARIL